MRNHGRFQEVILAQEADSQKILTEIMAKTRVRHFEQAKPSLHDIFVRIAGREAADIAGPSVKEITYEENA